ncbi:MAG: hypothetical protein LBD59_11410 [Prevotellaceae bacterium]|nr:hypothetical protein [Prevotellaceae bacterium]
MPAAERRSNPKSRRDDTLLTAGFSLRQRTRHVDVGTRVYLVHSIYAGCACICTFVGRLCLLM